MSAAAVEVDLATSTFVFDFRILSTFVLSSVFVDDGNWMIKLDGNHLISCLGYLICSVQNIDNLPNFHFVVAVITIIAFDKKFWLAGSNQADLLVNTILTQYFSPSSVAHRDRRLT